MENILFRFNLTYNRIVTSSQFYNSSLQNSIFFLARLEVNIILDFHKPEKRPNEFGHAYTGEKNQRCVEAKLQLNFVSFLHEGSSIHKLPF